MSNQQRNFTGIFSAAEELKERIYQYWWEAGFDIDVSIHKQDLGGSTIYAIRSNLINGMPPASARITNTDRALLPPVSAHTQAA